MATGGKQLTFRTAHGAPPLRERVPLVRSPVRYAVSLATVYYGGREGLGMTRVLCTAGSLLVGAMEWGTDVPPVAVPQRRRWGGGRGWFGLVGTRPVALPSQGV